MLKLRCLMVDNFGPFKGEQFIYFPEENGVTIIYGENMRGKTSLLNAIRYVLFGKIRDRGYRNASLHQISNWESAAEGRYGFKVVLAFEQDGDEYELTRSSTPRDLLPLSDQDYVEECFLRRNGNVLSAEQREVELHRIMPEQVSRFFLFDGELLQEYEELLRDESAMGQKITEAIERILGVPILTGVRTCLRELLQVARRQESKIAQKHQKTTNLGNHLDNLTQQNTTFEEEIDGHKKEVERLRERRASLEEIIRKSDRYAALIDERDRLEKEIEKIDARRVQKEEKLKEIMSDAWRSLLTDRVKAEREKVDEQIQSLQAKTTHHAVMVEAIRQIKRAIQEDQCPTCMRPLDEETTNRLTLIADSQYPDEETEETEELPRLMQWRQILRASEVASLTDIVQNTIDTIDQDIVDKASKDDHISEINDYLKDVNQGEIRKVRIEYNDLQRDIVLLEEGIKEETEKIKVNEEAIRRIQNELDKEAGSDLAKERSKREMYDKLCDLFDDSVKLYREQLRDRVEQDATSLFRKLTTESDYVGLKINESYGLIILHKDGSEIPVRSAGAEHIVALSLIGALHRNAPLSGPIIMDSPFGRLDEAHTTRVVQTLPDMADQVVLLVFESELKPQAARNQLLGKLRSEYQLVRQSARYTTIEKSME